MKAVQCYNPNLDRACSHTHLSSHESSACNKQEALLWQTDKVSRKINLTLEELEERLPYKEAPAMSQLNTYKLVVSIPSLRTHKGEGINKTEDQTEVMIILSKF